MIAFASAWTERQSSYLSPEGILSVSRVQVPMSEQQWEVVLTLPSKQQMSYL